MGIFQNLRDEVQDHFSKRKEERARFEAIQREVEFQKRQMFEERYKENALEVARASAIRAAEKKSGIAKLRAMNRADRLTEPGETSGTFWGKLSEYTQKNVARREDNIRRTEGLRDAAKKMREQKLVEQQRLRKQRISSVLTRKPQFK